MIIDYWGQRSLEVKRTDPRELNDWLRDNNGYSIDNGVDYKKSAFYAREVLEIDFSWDNVISYKNDLLSISTKDADLKKVLLKLSDKTNINIKLPVYIDKKITINKNGISLGEGLEYILKNDKSSIIYVTGPNHPIVYNIFALPREQAKRIQMVSDVNRANYLITNYRGHPQDYPFEAQKWHSIMVGNNTINCIYKLK